MTAAQRATLEKLERDKARCVELARSFLPHLVDMYTQQRDALRAALGTCGTCHWLGADDSYRGHGFCAAPAHLDPRRERFPFVHKLMPLGERCTGYTPKGGA